MGPDCADADRDHSLDASRQRGALRPAARSRALRVSGFQPHVRAVPAVTLPVFEEQKHQALTTTKLACTQSQLPGSAAAGHGRGRGGGSHMPNRTCRNRCLDVEVLATVTIEFPLNPKP